MQVVSGPHGHVCDKSWVLSHSLSTASLLPAYGIIFSDGSKHTEMVGEGNPTQPDLLIHPV